MAKDWAGTWMLALRAYGVLVAMLRFRNVSQVEGRAGGPGRDGWAGRGTETEDDGRPRVCGLLSSRLSGKSDQKERVRCIKDKSPEASKCPTSTRHHCSEFTTYHPTYSDLLRPTPMATFYQSPPAYQLPKRPSVPSSATRLPHFNPTQPLLPDQAKYVKSVSVVSAFLLWPSLALSDI